MAPLHLYLSRSSTDCDRLSHTAVGPPLPAGRRDTSRRKDWKKSMDLPTIIMHVYFCFSRTVLPVVSVTNGPGPVQTPRLSNFNLKNA
ncbi:hypothetical protein JOB18_040024 [Solea senegalensis]|uniref:Uncharacterized protein n=1 Tax=Solea senegalensis TaxID=28829 RepID=A0AAV6SBQ4_SOLSE|nr:hypothetical protein JOB18_040024 [Solea senegalensis]